MRFTIRDLLWLTALVAVALTLWIGWSRETAALRAERILRKSITAERDEAKNKVSSLRESNVKLVVETRLQRSALEHFGVKADAKAYRIVPITGSQESN